MDFSETIAASDLKVGRCRQLIEFMKVCEYWRSRLFLLPYIFQVLYVLCFTRPRYQVSVYRTIGPLVYINNLCFTLSSGSNSPADAMLSSGGPNHDPPPAPPSRPSPPGRTQPKGSSTEKSPQSIAADTTIVPKPMPKLRGNPTEVINSLDRCQQGSRRPIIPGFIPI